MKYQKSESAISFRSTLDYVEICREGKSYVMNLDAEDREAAYRLSENQTSAVAEALGMSIATNFIDFVEQAILAGKKDELVSAFSDIGKSEFFWMNTEQIEKFLIGGQQVTRFEED